MTTLEFATELAKEASRILLASFNSQNLQIAFKDDNSIVTKVDKDTDYLIRTRISTAFPNDYLLSEELNPEYIPEKAQSSFTWIIDPLDGTSNYSLGLHHWGILITRLKNGYPELTVQYFPFINELYQAQKGKGAFLNGKPINVQKDLNTRPHTIFTCCSRTIRHYKITIPYKMRILGSAAYSFCLISRGSAIVAFEATPKIWDIAGAWLLVKEAGGIIGTYHQENPFPLKTNNQYAHFSFPTMAASTKELFERSIHQIIPKT